jgi:DNA-binding winged helix-turn-helix (wHTH) protein
VWGEVTVDYDHSLKTMMVKVRKALGDDSCKPRYVETLPKRGWRFLRPVIFSDSRRHNEVA